ncbi:hypothetical protein BLOT_014004 [Blomia tropicalis]|nr:hypothetical protein BLOT_014004 [Blomia tropicalis]
MKDYGHRKDKLAVVVVGEASESEDDECDVAVDGGDVQGMSAVETIDKQVASHSNKSSLPSSSVDTLAEENNKLRTKESTLSFNNNIKAGEKNRDLIHNLANLSCTPYISYTKDISGITRQLIATHKHLQTGCAQVQKARNDINQLDKVFVSVSSLMSTNKL